jgi:hypothetical protein
MQEDRAMSGERTLQLQPHDAPNKLDPRAPILLQHLRVVLKSTIEQIHEHVERRIKAATAPLLQRIQELEAKPAIKYLGTFEANKAYMPGNAITHLGSLWVCVKPTSAPPKFDAPSDWQLAAKAGRPGRDKAA